MADLTLPLILARSHRVLTAAFFRWGWLLLAILPPTQLGGRALFNSLAGLYAVWGLLALAGRPELLDRWTGGFYLLLLLAFLAGVPGALYPHEALQTWAAFFMLSLSLPLTHAALRAASHHLDHFLKAMALGGGVTLVGLLLSLPYYGLGWSGQPFDPSSQLREDSLPFLLPFLLYGCWRQGSTGWRWLMAAAIASSLGYVVLAEGRAALLALVVGLMVFYAQVLGWRWRWGGLAAGVLLALGVLLNTGPFHKSQLDTANPVDAFTAGRTILWRHALNHPPERAWLGLGMGQQSSLSTGLKFTLGGEETQVRHLHNVFLDVWQETGLWGLAALLALLGAVFGRLARVWNQLKVDDQQRAGVLLAAALALATAGLLSFSYTSRYFACYFLACLGGLSALSAAPVSTQSTAADKNPDKP